MSVEHFEQNRREMVTSAMMTQFVTLTLDEPVDAAVQRTRQGEFPVVDSYGRPLGVLGRNDLIRVLKERGPGASVADVMTTNIRTVNKSRCLEDAFRLLQEKSVPAVGVVDEAGRFDLFRRDVRLNGTAPRRWSPWTEPHPSRQCLVQHQHFANGLGRHQPDHRITPQLKG
jgi:CBS-domain-containing membrane protein